MSKSLVTVKTDNITSDTKDVDLHRWLLAAQTDWLTGLIPDQNLRNDVVTPKLCFIFSYHNHMMMVLSDMQTQRVGLTSQALKVTLHGTIRRFLAQHRVQMLKQYCSRSNQCNNNVVTLCYAEIVVANRPV